MDLFDLVWSNDISFESKLEILTNLKLDLQEKITNRKELTFDIYYKFSKEFDKLKSVNQQGKQVVLALKVIRVARKGFKKYKINLRKATNGQMFIDFFKDTIDCSKNYLCRMGINFYSNDTYTFKTFINGAYTLLYNNLIGEEMYNSFMKYLERKSYGR